MSKRRRRRRPISSAPVSPTARGTSGSPSSTTSLPGMTSGARTCGSSPSSSGRRSWRFAACAQFRSLAEAAARPIAVDSTTNGFVLVLYRALARAGIDWRTCRFDTVGGVRQRYEALEGGRASSTILVPPFIDRAVAAGFTRLWSSEAIAPAYPGVVVAARADWLSANGDAVARYVGALAAANRWAAGPANHDAAVVALAAAALRGGGCAPARARRRAWPRTRPRWL